MSFNIHLKKFSVVHSDSPNHVYLNPLSDSRIRLRGVAVPLEVMRCGVRKPVLGRVPR
jgi:hypothetical protein